MAAALLVCCLVPLSGRAMEYIGRDQWAGIQRGIQVTQYSKVANVVHQLDRVPGSSIAILHPGDAAGHDWAVEIRDWLVALGVPGSRIVLRPGSGRPESVGLRVEEPGSR